MTQTDDQIPVVDVPPAWRKTKPLWPFSFGEMVLLVIVVTVFIKWIIPAMVSVLEPILSVLDITSSFWQHVITIGVWIAIARAVDTLFGSAKKLVKRVRSE